jgi:hypothetical protein
MHIAERKLMQNNKYFLDINDIDTAPKKKLNRVPTNGLQLIACVGPFYMKSDFFFATTKKYLHNK